MSLLLQNCFVDDDAFPKSQRPFHFAGGGGMPRSLYEGWPGVTPVSRTPMMTPSPMSVAFHTLWVRWRNPKNRGVWVVIGR